MSAGRQMRMVTHRAACVAALLCLSSAPLQGSPAGSDWDRAVAARTQFEAEPGHTRAGFTQVLDGFRAIYHANPAATHAPDAVYQVAELLAERGRELADERSLRAAVGQYEFLRTQYPQSHLRADALLAEARLEETDLHDGADARTLYAAVVRESPGSKAATEARLALAGQSQPVENPTARNDAAMSGAQVDSDETAVRPTRAAAHAGQLAEVTGIRHWSTPTYTRVAIDLGDEVKFEAARVPHPERIYFDLHGARLSPELVGRSFDVTDDGFLKRIRAAQSGADVTRVVLDVNEVTEYSAFLLPNPYRLIIDIHGRKPGSPAADATVPGTVVTAGSRAELVPRPARSAETAALPSTDALQTVPVPPAAVHTASVAANRSGLPPMAVTDGGEAVRPAAGPAANHSGEQAANETSTTGTARHPSAPAPRTGMTTKSTPARPVPNTVAVKAPATTTEVAAVSAAPGRVDATAAPTSRPIASVVRGGGATAATTTTRSDPAAVAVPGAGVPERTPTTLAPNPPARTTAGAPARAAARTADGETSLVRALGLRVGRIVIDAGHGGHDSGTLGVDGIQEKDVVLDVALRLGKLLHERLGAEIIYTRSDDTFIPLETRTAIANKAQADLFLSIHANSSPDPSARGVEVYYLNFTSDPTALDVAARENAVGGQGVHQLSDLVKKIALKDKIEESREFAADVDASLFAGITKGNEGLRNRGVKKAPFVVLIGANMPSILAEISFVTNARDAAQLREPEYRERVAESIYNGVARYESGLAGAKLPEVKRAAAR